MKVWIDQDLCTGAGVCAEMVPELFVMVDSLAYVKNGPESPVGGIEGKVTVPSELEEAVCDAAYDCPGDCIFLEP